MCLMYDLAYFVDIYILYMFRETEHIKQLGKV